MAAKFHHSSFFGRTSHLWIILWSALYCCSCSRMSCTSLFEQIWLDSCERICMIRCWRGPRCGHRSLDSGQTVKQTVWSAAWPPPMRAHWLLPNYGASGVGRGTPAKNNSSKRASSFPQTITLPSPALSSLHLGSDVEYRPGSSATPR